MAGTGHKWQPGQSGNPKGRPKTGKRLTDVLRRVLDEPTAEGRTKADDLAETLWKLAEQGNLDALKYIYDRLDGKPVETQQLSGAEGGPVRVTLRWASGSDGEPA